MQPWGMPYATPFVLTTVEGYFGTAPGLDIWRVTWKMPLPGAQAPSTASLQAYVDTVRGPALNYHGTATVAAGTNTFLTGTAAAVIGTDGKYLGGGFGTTVRSITQTPVAGIGTMIHPLSTALCVTMGSTRARGPASRGRFYWPATAIGIGVPDGLVPTTPQTTIRNAATTFIQNINAAAQATLGSGYYVSLMSQVGAGVNAPVTRVSIGRKVDHQERREGELSEGHVWNPVPAMARIVERETEEWDAAIQREVEARYADLDAYDTRQSEDT